MNTSTVLHCPPNTMPAQALLQELVTKYPTVLGFAVRNEGELVCESHMKGWSVKDVTDLLTHAKDDHRVIHFGNWPTAPVEGDVPPYVMLDQDNLNILAIFPEGDFSGFSGLDGEHADEYCMSSDSLFPKLEKMIKEVDGDQKKFLEALASEKMARFLTNTYKHRGYFLFLPKEGEPIIHDFSTIGAKYTFGTLSNAEGLNYKEEQAKAPDPEPVSFLDKIRGKKPAAETPPPVPPQPEVQVPKNVTKPAGTETLISLVEMAPPKSLVDGGAKNHWLRLFNGKAPGKLPDNHTAKNITVWVHPGLVPFAKRDVKSIGEMKRLTEEVKGFIAKGGQVLDFKAEAPKPVENKEKEKTKSSTREPYVPSGSTLAFLSDKEKMLGVEVVGKYLDVKSNQRMSPLEIQKLEANYGQFSDEIGSTFEELLFVPPQGLLELFGGNKIAVSAFIQMKRRYIEGAGVKLEDLIGTKGDEPKVVNAEPEKGTEKTEAPAQTSGGFSFLRKSAA